MPTNLREISHPQKQNLWDPCEPKKHHKSGDSCEEKGSEDGWVPLPSEPFLEKNYCYLLWFLCFDDKHKGSGYHKVNTCQSEHIRL